MKYLALVAACLLALSLGAQVPGYMGKRHALTVGTTVTFPFVKMFAPFQTEFLAPKLSVQYQFCTGVTNSVMARFEYRSKNTTMLTDDLASYGDCHVKTWTASVAYQTFGSNIAPIGFYGGYGGGVTKYTITTGGGSFYEEPPDILTPFVCFTVGRQDVLFDFLNVDYGSRMALPFYGLFGFFGEDLPMRARLLYYYGLNWYLSLGVVF